MKDVAQEFQRIKMDRGHYSEFLLNLKTYNLRINNLKFSNNNFESLKI